MRLQAGGPAPATCSGIFSVEKSSVTALESGSAGNLGIHYMESVGVLAIIMFYTEHGNAGSRKQTDITCQRQVVVNILIGFLLCEILMTFFFLHCIMIIFCSWACGTCLNPLIREAEADRSEFEASLVYKASSMTARHVSKTNKQSCNHFP